MAVDLKPKDHVIYSALASTGHYGATVLSVRDNGTADIELKDTGFGDPVRLSLIPVVESVRDLVPGSCAKNPE